MTRRVAGTVGYRPSSEPTSGGWRKLWSWQGRMPVHKMARVGQRPERRDEAQRGNVLLVDGACRLALSPPQAQHLHVLGHHRPTVCRRGVVALRNRTQWSELPQAVGTVDRPQITEEHACARAMDGGSAGGPSPCDTRGNVQDPPPLVLEGGAEGLNSDHKGGWRLESGWGKTVAGPHGCRT